MPEPVYWPNQNRTQDSKPFMKWKVGEPPTEFEVPHYYRNLRAVRFGTPAATAKEGSRVTKANLGPSIRAHCARPTDRPVSLRRP